MSADPIYTLSDLEKWSFNGTALAVLGHPIKHSISPPMHNAALAEMARTEPQFKAWRYFRFDIPPDDLPRALDLFREKKFLGLNLTVPHKTLAVKHVSKIDDAARPIGAVNTLKNTAPGWHGYNTDGYGLSAGIRETLGCNIQEQHIILLGAGGAARGAAVECRQRATPSLWIGNRTKENLDALLKDIGSSSAHPASPRGFDPHNPPVDLPTGALVINATSAGLRPTDEPPIDLSRIPRPAAVYDMIYNPPETRLLAQARSLNIPAANGLSMLIHQGARALEIWSERPVPVAIMRDAATAALNQGK